MWEALTAIGTIASAAVIAVTVIMAARQVRLTTDQLEQSRRATQFEAARSVLLEMVEPDFVDAYRFIIHDLPALMHDEAFYRGIAQVGLADYTVHQEVYLLRALERIGTYVRFGLVDGEIVYGSYQARIVLSWELLSDVVAIHRQIAGPQFWVNAQFLHDDCVRWLKANNIEFNTPAVLRRMNEFTTSAAPQPVPDAPG
ncbi:MAG TPA: hypothetical protein VID19_01060 [Candidatus Eremiobacteraceae bacterium]|jgi:hypothetical protein